MGLFIFEDTLDISLMNILIIRVFSLSDLILGDVPMKAFIIRLSVLGDLIFGVVGVCDLLLLPGILIPLMHILNGAYVSILEFLFGMLISLMDPLNAVNISIFVPLFECLIYLTYLFNWF